MRDSQERWSEEEFGSAKLGDPRRVRRLVAVAAEAARRPAGQVTAVFDDDAEREGAFRLVGNVGVRGDDIALAAHQACARRSAGEEWVFVAVDESSLNLTDTKRRKGLGHVGARFIGAQGMQVITAMAVTPQGVPLGLCGQKYWVRVSRSTRRSAKHDLRKTEEKETQHWITVMQQVREVYSTEAASTVPWFQIDREGDAWPILLQARAANQRLTVRASHDRRLETEGERRHLWDTLEQQACLGSYELDIPPKPERRLSKQRTAKVRQGRHATIEVRAGSVTLSLLDERTAQRHTQAISAVLAREVSAPEGEEPIEWLLLTTAPVTKLEEAKLVIFGYTQRWRIEDFHRAWKSGVCDVEDTQLRGRDRIIRWATILASVAVRTIRLTYLARHQPQRPALEEFSRAELDAILLASKRTRHLRGTTPSILDAVTFLAKLGGYTGKASGGPPGPLVLARGLGRIEVLADVLSLGSHEILAGV
jgi:Transposase DNA-binding/Transposase DDE domain